MDEHDVAMICALGRRLMGNAFLFPQRLRDLFDFSEFLALTEGVGQPEFEQLHGEIKAFFSNVLSEDGSMYVSKSFFYERDKSCLSLFFYVQGCFNIDKPFG